MSRCRPVNPWRPCAPPRSPHRYGRERGWCRGGGVICRGGSRGGTGRRRAPRSEPPCRTGTTSCGGVTSTPGSCSETAARSRRSSISTTSRTSGSRDGAGWVGVGAGRRGRAPRSQRASTRSMPGGGADGRTAPRHGPPRHSCAPRRTGCVSAGPGSGSWRTGTRPRPVPSATPSAPCRRTVVSSRSSACRPTRRTSTPRASSWRRYCPGCGRPDRRWRCTSSDGPVRRSTASGARGGGARRGRGPRRRAGGG